VNALHFITICWRAWKTLRACPVAYVTVNRSGVPNLALFVARDREAWRVVQYAVETGLVKR